MDVANNDPQLRHLDRIVAAMPSGYTHLTTQKAFYVAISRARDTAELVTDDAKRLADRLERVTDDRVAVLDAAKKYVVLGIEIGGEPSLERGDSRARATHDAMDRDREGEREPEREREAGHGIEHGTDRELDRKSPDQTARQDREAPDSSGRARETERGYSRSRESERRTGREIAPEPKPKSVDMDFGL